ncbi:alpha-N-methyltransferase NTM1 [Boletus reticuloceps]|uniref:Alpha N-terminal protein methyltransferase 1 n=1 Tax=Boletus reticuloceps TaxID=495285 RepID=A0A8I2YDT4_9AGAM|nr:alpha-N-methyltransferase NTM1 [Boletus reticuloceps]
MTSSAGARDGAVVQAGLQYWETQPASLDGVLGGFGTGSLPRVDALGSRQFLLHLIPELRIVPSAIRPLQLTNPEPPKRYRALDVGAGIGRVTADVLLHLVSDVVLLEPVQSFIEEAHRRCQGTSTSEESSAAGWTGIADRSKSVAFFKGPLQDFDPARPRQSTEELQRLGYIPEGEDDDTESRFDVIWCQWCLGHLNDEDLIAFLKRSAMALRGPTSLIVVKENLCSEKKAPRTVFDGQDSSWTRSDLAFKMIFKDAGLHLVREKIQRGFPVGIYPVKMYALRPNM